MHIRRQNCRLNKMFSTFDRITSSFITAFWQTRGQKSFWNIFLLYLLSWRGSNLQFFDHKFGALTTRPRRPTLFVIGWLGKQVLHCTFFI